MAEDHAVKADASRAPTPPDATEAPVEVDPGTPDEMPAAAPDEAAVWRALEGVSDPEIPVLNLVEMGIVRAVEVAADGSVRVDLTPTFSGCPALGVMRAEAAAAVEALGAPGEELRVEVRVVHAPPWSSDDLHDSAREKLRAFGLAPPAPHGGLIELLLDAPRACPRCNTLDTEARNHFGPTLCREIHWCNRCGEPFEAFKPL